MAHLDVPYRAVTPDQLHRETKGQGIGVKPPCGIWLFQLAQQRHRDVIESIVCLVSNNRRANHRLGHLQLLWPRKFIICCKVAVILNWLNAANSNGKRVALGLKLPKLKERVF